MIESGEYNNSLIEGNWSIALPNSDYIWSKIMLWHHCPKTGAIRWYEQKDIHPKRAICIDCKEEPSEVFMTTFMML